MLSLGGGGTVLVKLNTRKERASVWVTSFVQKKISLRLPHKRTVLGCRQSQAARLAFNTRPIPKNELH